MPFGGAGPMHAAALADELGMSRLLCPRASGVLSALGLIASDRRRDTARTVMLAGDDLTAERVAAEVAALRESLAAGLEDATVEVTYELRYCGPGVRAPRPGPRAARPRRACQRFAAEHERRYGYRDPDARGRAREHPRGGRAWRGPSPEPRAATPAALERRTRSARFGGEWAEATVLRGEPEAGVEAEGPCIFELPEATLVLPPGWRARVDDRGTIVAERAG